MSAARIDMHRLQEVVRLHRLGLSGRAISKQLKIGRNTIAPYLEALRKVELLDGEAIDLPDVDTLRAAIDKHVPAKAAAQQTSSIDAWAEQVERLRKKGAGPKAIHDWFRLHDTDFTGSLSAVKRMCRRFDVGAGPKPTDVAIPVDTVAGEIAQVDFGYVGKIFDPVSGKLRKAWLFVMALGFSRRMYLDIVFDQKVETWLELHVSAFEYFGGVPHVVVPDNLKAAVIRAAFAVDDEPELHRSYRELAQYYGFRIDPTPPRSPEKKGKVERSVLYVKGNFFKTTDSIDIREDRRSLRRWNEEVADTRTHGTTGRRPIDLFEEFEREALLPLPSKRWEKVIWKSVTLHRDSHVQVEGAFYSAPWVHLSKKLWSRRTANAVEIYLKGELLWTHSRVPRGTRSTVEAHLPEHRSDLRHRSREHWGERARKIGSEVEQVVEAIFESDDALLNLRKVQSVVTHLESFPKKRACAAARRALHFGTLTYGCIKSILKKGIEHDPLPEEKKRGWSTGSRYARKPEPNLFQESSHGNH